MTCAIASHNPTGTVPEEGEPGGADDALGEVAAVEAGGQAGGEPPEQGRDGEHEGEPEDLHRHFNTVEAPLNSLSDK